MRIHDIIYGVSKTKKLFLVLLIVIGVLFVGCAASIFAVFLKDFDTDSANVLGLVALFFHLLILAVIFYLTFKAYWLDKSSLLAVFTLDEKGNLIKNTRTVAIVVMSLFLTLGIYMTLLVCNLSLPLSFFVKSLKFTLMNIGYSIGILALFFVLYPIVTRG